jgi:nitrogen regulatory protein P-II 1
MKRVEVTMPPAKLDELKDALAEVGIPGMTVQEARVFGRANRRREVYLGSLYVVDFVLNVKVVIVVRNDSVARILEVLERWPGIREKGGGSVLVSDVAEAVRIRTGERGEDALDRPPCSLPRQEPCNCTDKTRLGGAWGARGSRTRRRASPGA